MTTKSTAHPTEVPTSHTIAETKSQGATLLCRIGTSVGRATATRLAQSGGSIVICDEDEEKLSSLEKELSTSNAHVLGLTADMGSVSAVREVVDKAISAFGNIDVLVNGLPADAYDPFSNLSPWENLQSTHATAQGVLTFIETVLPHMVSASRGQIVNVVSSAGRYRSSYFHPDGATNESLGFGPADASILGMTREIAFRMAPRGIRVNAVTVGWIRSSRSEEIWKRMSDRDKTLLTNEISLRRFGEPDEVAAVIEFLAKDDSSYITGTAIDVNGGLWMS